MGIGANAIAQAIKAKKARKIVKARIKVMANIANIAKNHGFNDEWVLNVFTKAGFIIPQMIPQMSDERVVHNDEAIKIIKSRNRYLVYFRDRSGFEHYLGYFVKH
jgi:hypothetical protein